MCKGWTMCTDGTFCCCDSSSCTCNNATLVLSPISEPELVDASTRINQILDEVRGHNQDPNRELALLGIPEEQSNGTVLLLAWVRSGISAESNMGEIKKVLF